MKNWIKKLLGLKHEIDNTFYRRLLYQYFYRNEWGCETSITYIKVFKHRRDLTIEIETYRPGLLIGKAGRFINGLREYILSEVCIKDLKIDIKECRLWYKLY